MVWIKEETKKGLLHDTVGQVKRLEHDLLTHAGEMYVRLEEGRGLLPRSAKHICALPPFLRPMQSVQDNSLGTNHNLSPMAHMPRRQVRPGIRSVSQSV